MRKKKSPHACKPYHANKKQLLDFKEKKDKKNNCKDVGWQDIRSA